jgi:hypothetical protein
MVEPDNWRGGVLQEIAGHEYAPVEASAFLRNDEKVHVEIERLPDVELRASGFDFAITPDGAREFAAALIALADATDGQVTSLVRDPTVRTESISKEEIKAAPFGAASDG